MSEFGGLDDAIEVREDEQNVVPIETAKKFVRKPFHYWKVGDRELKLKLNASMIEKVEQKFGNRNIMLLVMADEIPSLTTMLTIIQGAATPWNHGVTYNGIKSMYDRYADDGGSQEEFLANVLMPTLVVSGFFTLAQSEEIMKSLEEETANL